MPDNSVFVIAMVHPSILWGYHFQTKHVSDTKKIGIYLTYVDVNQQM